MAANKPLAGGASRTECLVRGTLMMGALWLVLVALSWVMLHWDLDRGLTARFYRPEDGFFLGQDWPWSWVYKYGTWPGLLLTLGSLFAWCLCLVRESSRHLRRSVLVVLLTAILGPGLLVNGVLKDHWGRPRPRQTMEFGGQMAYQAVNQPGIPGRGKSFPCGHATMGYLFMSLLVFWRKAKWLALGGACFGFLWGSFIGLARVIQGAHFLSDSLWSMGAVLTITIMLYYWVLQVPCDRPLDSHPIPSGRKRWIITAIVTAALLITLSFLAHRPYYESARLPLPLPPATHALIVSSNMPLSLTRIQYTSDDTATATINSWGFSWPTAKFNLDRQVHETDGTVRLTLELRQKGYFAESNHEVLLTIPQWYKNRLIIRFDPPQP